MEASTVGAWLVSESATQLQGFDGMFGAAFRLWSTWINKQSSCLHRDTVGILRDIWVKPWFAMNSDLSDMSWTKIWKTDRNAKKTPYGSTCKILNLGWWSLWSLDWLRYPNQHTTANVDYGLGRILSGSMIFDLMIMRYTWGALLLSGFVQQFRALQPAQRAG